jgi:coenzyme Q-binding protein COQ10
MARCLKRRILAYAPDDLFALVGDVRRYPEFVPWISAMRVWNEKDEGEGVSLLDAEAVVGFAILRERFATRVRRDALRRTIRMTLLNGPLTHLRGEWRFQPHPSGTELEFEVDFQFKSRMLDRMLSLNLDLATARIIGCFEGRARSKCTPMRGGLNSLAPPAPPADPAAGPARA